MGFDIEVRTPGLDQQIQSFRHVSELASDWRPVFRAVVPAWAESNLRMFRTSGLSKGVPWVRPRGDELNIYVRGYKEGVLGRRVRRRELLIFDKGHNARKLLRSLTETQNALFIGNPEASTWQLLLGTRVDYSQDHDGKTRAPDRFGGYMIPRREHVLLGQDMEQRIQEINNVFALQLAVMMGQRITTGDLQGIAVAAGGVL